jgi:hypothetical protein
MLVPILFFIVSCEKDNVWGEGLEKDKNTFYVTNYKDTYSNFLTYEIAANGTTRSKEGSNNTNGTFGDYGSAWQSTGTVNQVNVPFWLNSEQTTSYNPTSFVWVSPSAGLVAGTDYQVLSASGAVLSPSAGITGKVGVIPHDTIYGAGAYEMNWPKSQKGIQSLVIKRLSTKTGRLTLNVLNPLITMNTNDVSLFVNIHTDQYEMRGISMDFNHLFVDFK